MKSSKIGEKFLNLLAMLSQKKVVGFSKIRLGANSTVEYVLINDFNDVKIAYSIGIDKFVLLLKLYQKEELMFICMIILLKTSLY